jgi:Tfp pilus assembly protein PilO
MSLSNMKGWQLHAAGTTLVLALAGGAYLLLIGPAISRHEQAAAQSAALNAEQSKSRELERTLLSLKEKLSRTEKEAAKAELKLEPVGQLNSRLARLTELAASQRLRVDSIESGQTISSARYATISIRLSGQGSYRNCAALLKSIQTQMPDVVVMAMDLGSGGITSDTTATFAFDLLWYTQPADSIRKN